MGMDVYGIAPKCYLKGEYFRANCWSWRPIMEAMWDSGACEHVDEKNWELMSENSGGGARSQEACLMMADTLENWMEREFEGTVYSPESLDFDDCQVVKEPNKHGGHSFTDKCDADTMSPYRVHRNHLEEWVTFLRHCGEGFQVF